MRVLGAAFLSALLAFACSQNGGNGSNDDDVVSDDDDDLTGTANDDDDTTDDDDDDLADPPDDDDTDPGPECGDGRTEFPEVCDDSEEPCTTGGYDGLRTCRSDCAGWSDCVAEGACGDGRVSGPETCDDGPGEGEGRCLDDCTGRQVCGNGQVEGTESCEISGEPGNPCCLLCEQWLEEGAACDDNPGDCLEGICQANQCLYSECPGAAGACGDRVCEPEGCVFSGEAGAHPCPDDDPCRDVLCVASGGDADSADCLLGEAYPDGTACDDGSEATLESYCQSAVCVAPECGNGLVQPGEVCDGGSPEACTTLTGYPGLRECRTDCKGFTDCLSDSYCGDGVVQGPEYCDSQQPSGCEVSGLPGEQLCQPHCGAHGACVWTGECGDGTVQPWEMCETHQSQPCVTADEYPGGRPCLNCTGYGACATSHYCGDGLTNGPEECDENGVPSETCTNDCKSLKVGCGNRRVEPELGEICDDGLDNGRGPLYCRKGCLSIQPLVPNPMGRDYVVPNFMAGDLTAPSNAGPFVDFFVNDNLIPGTLLSFPGKTCLSDSPYPGYNCTWDTAWCYPNETCQDTPAYDRETRTLDGHLCFAVKFDGVVVQQDDTEACILFEDAQYSSPPNVRIRFPGPKTFTFQSFDMDIIDFDLRAHFNASADTLIIDQISGLLDTEDIRQQTHFDICLYIICNPDRTLYVEVRNMQAALAEFPVRYLAP